MKKFFIFMLAVIVSGCSSTKNYADTDIMQCIELLNEDELSLIISLYDPWKENNTSRCFFCECSRYYVYSSNEYKTVKSLHRYGFINGFEEIQKIINTYGRNSMFLRGYPSEYMLDVDINELSKTQKNEIEIAQYYLSPKGIEAQKFCIKRLRESISYKKNVQKSLK